MIWQHIFRVGKQRDLLSHQMLWCFAERWKKTSLLALLWLLVCRQIWSSAGCAALTHLSFSTGASPGALGRALLGVSDLIGTILARLSLPDHCKTPLGAALSLCLDVGMQRLWALGSFLPPMNRVCVLLRAHLTSLLCHDHNGNNVLLFAFEY